MTRPTIVAGNWKLNPPRGEGESLFRDVCAGVAARSHPTRVEVLLFPPYPYLAVLASDGPVGIGAQDVSSETWGAFTGEVSGELLREFGVTHVIVGHSERRHVFGENDDQVARKARAALDAGLLPLVCVGETEAERDGGDTFEVLARQLDVVLERTAADRIVIAYEPVWAIGTGRTATPEMAAEAHGFVRERLAEKRGQTAAAETAILYGGSVKSNNARDLLSQEEIDGALVGGASLAADSFLGIIAAADDVTRV